MGLGGWGLGKLARATWAKLGGWEPMRVLELVHWCTCPRAGKREHTASEGLQGASADATILQDGTGMCAACMRCGSSRGPSANAPLPPSPHLQQPRPTHRHHKHTHLQCRITSTCAADATWAT